MKIKDKIKHFLISFIFAVLIYWFGQSYLLTIFAVLFLSLAKEWYDQQNGKNNLRQSLTDLLADGLGLALGISFIYIFVQYFYLLRERF